MTVLDDPSAQSSVIGFNRPGQLGYSSSSVISLRRRIAEVKKPLSRRLDTKSNILANAVDEPELTTDRIEGAESSLNTMRKSIDTLSHHSHSPLHGRSSITGLEKWSAQVVAVDDSYFEAELIADGLDTPPLLVEFSLDSVSSEDESLVRVGAAFYVTVRTVEEYGRKARTSSLRFRRLGVWGADEVDDIHERARDLARRVDRFTD